MAYVGGLDGLRAVSVLLIMAYHDGISSVRGGFVAVNVFFVLSGYLITSLLLGEWSRTHAIALGRFWSRRARRLLPALFLMLGGVALYGAVAAPAGSLGQLRGDALATLGYFANWHYILADQGYFAQQALPSPLLHTWTLAIEEQFYILWPLVILLVLRWRRSTRAVLWVAVAGAAASAVAMVVLYHPGAEPIRVYYGTDTRAQDLLVGGALAALLLGRPAAGTRAARRGIGGLALAGTAVFACITVFADGSTASVFRGGFTLVDVAVAAVIAAVIQVPAGFFSRLLSLRPLRDTGKISYGLYLWHWPVFIYLDGARTGLTGWRLLALRAAISFAIAIASYHLVEMPIRSGRRIRSWRAWALTPAAVAATAAVVLAATVPVATNLAAGRTAPAGHRARTPAAASGPPVRVLLVGDSMAFLLGETLYYAEGAYDARVVNDGTVGCGLARGGPISWAGSTIASDASCGSWQAAWTREVASVDPDVAVVFVGPWEVADRVHDGRWEHIGEPGYDAYERHLLEQAVRVLSARGADVVFLTSPYFLHGEQGDGTRWPEDDPARVDRLNQMIRRVADRHPGVVRVVPVGAMVSPHGRFTDTMDGQVIRTPDGLHLSVAGAEMVTPTIMSTVVRAGRDAAAARDRRLHATPAPAPPPGSSAQPERSGVSPRPAPSG